MIQREVLEGMEVCEVGHQARRSGDWVFRSGLGRDQSNSETSPGVVHHEALEGMEVGDHFNGSESEAGQVVTVKFRVENIENHMVDLPDGTTSDGGGVMSSAHHVVSNLKSSNVGRSRPNGMIDRAKEDGEAFEEQAQHNAYSEPLIDDGDEHACFSERPGNGRLAIQSNFGIRGGAEEKDGVLDRMEFEEGGAAATAF